MGNLLLAAALFYAARGWKVFPIHVVRNCLCSCAQPDCDRVAKHSRIYDWRKNASSDARKIYEWWQAWPDANIGIATGSASKIFALDVDPRHGAHDQLQALFRTGRDFSRTQSFSTSADAFQLLFNLPTTMRIDNRTNIFSGVDVRGEGGYVIVPPSVQSTGVKYTWLREPKNLVVADAPSWLLAILSTTRQFRNGVHDTALFDGAKEIFDHSDDPVPASGEENRSHLSVIDGASAARSMTTAKKNTLPQISPAYLPERIASWLCGIADRYNVGLAFAAMPAIMAFARIIAMRLGVYADHHGSKLVRANLRGAVVGEHSYAQIQAFDDVNEPFDKFDRGHEKLACGFYGLEIGLRNNEMTKSQLKPVSFKIGAYDGASLRDKMRSEEMNGPQAMFSSCAFGIIEPRHLTIFNRDPQRKFALFKRVGVMLHCTKPLSQARMSVHDGDTCNAIENFIQVLLARKVTSTLSGVHLSRAAQKIATDFAQEIDYKINDQDFDRAHAQTLQTYTKLLPILALIFWVLEEPENIHRTDHISLSATKLALKWCRLFEAHAQYIYDDNQDCGNEKNMFGCLHTTLALA